MMQTTALTWIDGEWQDGNTPIFSGLSHAVWLSSLVFDGARYFEGVAPDLDLHCQRVIDSAQRAGYPATISAEEIHDLVWQGIDKFPRDTALYIRPTIWAEHGFIMPDSESARFCLVLDPMPMPKDIGFAACLSHIIQRPLPTMAPTDTKAACLYPNSGRAIAEAKQKGYDNAVVKDALGNIAEFASANLFMVKAGQYYTPAINGTFLNGITRQRVIALLEKAGYPVNQCQITPAILAEADEIFSTGNYGKLQAVTKYEQRALPMADGYKRVRDLYWDNAHKEHNRNFNYANLQRPY